MSRHGPRNSELHHSLTEASTGLYGKQLQQKTPAEILRYPLVSAWFMYRPFYTAKMVRRWLGTPGNLTVFACRSEHRHSQSPTILSAGPDVQRHGRHSIMKQGLWGINLWITQ